MSNRAAGEEGRALLLQMHCCSIGSNAHTQGTALEPWDSDSIISEPAFGRPPFPLPMRLQSPSKTAQQHGTNAPLALPAVNPPQDGVSHHTCFNYKPFPNTGTNPIHKHRLEWGLLPGDADAQPWPSVFLSCGFHPVVSCHSLRSRGGARTLVNS